MRVTRETLLRIAKETAIKQSLSDKGLVAAYLTGSLLTEDPFLGGTTDIDLVLVHAETPKTGREIQPLTPDVHLDIRHTCRSDYAKPKELRVHPALGPEMYNPLWLFETQHFLEFVQAAVRTRYHDPANVLGRSRASGQNARQLWLEMQSNPPSGPEGMHTYLRSVSGAADAVALLNGAPLAERRFLLQFPARAVAAEHPDLVAGLSALVGGAEFSPDGVNELLPAWEKDFMNAAGRPHTHESISATRLPYYKTAFSALLNGEMPQAVLWPLVHSWTLAAQSLPPGLQGKWQDGCEKLGLGAGTLAERLDGLDHFLDEIEEIQEAMAASHGM
jgi:hypothetical protein